MRDLQPRNHRQIPQNRVKKAPKQRKPINWRPMLALGSKLTAGAALCAGITGGGYALYRVVSATTFLPLETIEVSPLTRLSKSDLIALAGVQTGESMLSLRLKDIAEQVSKNPWIKEVHIRRLFPSTLSISVAERQPRAVVNIGCLYYLDNQGKLFKALSEGDRLDFPLVTGVSEQDLTQDPDGSQQAFLGALKLIDELKAGAVFNLADVSEIHYDKGYGYTLFTMQGGVPVKIGNGEFGEKLARLSRIYPDLKRQMLGLDYVDLDYSDKIIVKKV